MPLSSLKANVGHGESAAGTSGLLNLALGLLARTTSPNAQLRALNLHVGAARQGAALALPTQLAILAGAAAAAGGVSSFGYSGTIAHAVLLCAGADANAHEETTGWTPLHCAVSEARLGSPVWWGSVVSGLSALAPFEMLVSGRSFLLAALARRIAGCYLSCRYSITGKSASWLR